MSIRTVTCKCIDCGRNFESLLTIANVCFECDDIRLIIKKDGEEFYSDVPRKDRFEAKKYWIEQGYEFCYFTEAKPFAY